MTETTNTPVSAELSASLPDETETLLASFVDWARTEFVWYAGSFTMHLLALSLLLLLGPIMSHMGNGGAPEFESKAPEEAKPTDIDPIDQVIPPDIGADQPDDPDFDPKIMPLAQQAQPEVKYDKNSVFEPDGRGSPDGTKSTHVGGSMGLFAPGTGAKVAGDIGIGGIGPNLGGQHADGNGSDWLKGRGIGHQKLLAGTGGTKESETTVIRALIWLANHQLSDGSWSLQNYVQRCTDKSCTGQGNVSADAGATALGLLPFLATGVTHKTQGPYQQHVYRGIAWLLRNQQPDGNLAKGAHQMMYSHGLATIALSEAYGLSGDRQVGMAAQKAVDFILAAQNRSDGGWRYNPNDPGDTSVVGWQLMALKSAHLAGLSVGGSVFSGTSKWLDSVAVHDGAEYSYQPGQGASPAMTSVGLLCRQYLGAKRKSPMLTGGMDFLLNHMPDEGFKNVYYWYYATQVMHNMNGAEWDKWNRKMRNLLVQSQVRDGTCANGSWDPANDAWGRQGGRVMQTALSTLTLEVYYRYLPLFKAGSSD